MSLLIEMSRVDIQCLLDNLPQGSDLREILGRSDATVFSNIRPTGFSNPIVCSEIQARRLLRIAQKNCPVVTKKIQEGIRLSGLEFLER